MKTIKFILSVLLVLSVASCTKGGINNSSSGLVKKIVLYYSYWEDETEYRFEYDNGRLSKVTTQENGDDYAVVTYSYSDDYITGTTYYYYDGSSSTCKYYIENDRITSCTVDDVLDCTYVYSDESAEPLLAQWISHYTSGDYIRSYTWDSTGTNIISVKTGSSETVYEYTDYDDNLPVQMIFSTNYMGLKLPGLYSKKLPSKAAYSGDDAVYFSYEFDSEGRLITIISESQSGTVTCSIEYY